jgi:hypothetical protein
MAEDDESTSNAEEGAEVVDHGPTAGAGPRWKGWKLVTQLTVPLLVLAIAFGVVVGGTDGLLGGGTDGEREAPTSAPSVRPAEEICEQAVRRLEQVLHKPREPDPIVQLMKATEVLSLAAERLEETPSLELARVFSGYAGALEDLTRAEAARNRKLIPAAEARLRESSRRAERVARSEAAPACVRLARLLR